MPRLLRLYEQLVDLDRVYAVEVIDREQERRMKVHLDLPATEGGEWTFEVKDNDAYYLKKALNAHQVSNQAAGARAPLKRFRWWFIDTSRIVRAVDVQGTGRTFDLWLLLPRERIATLRLEGNSAYDFWHDFGKSVPME
jgi:hypothetical protein